KAYPVSDLLLQAAQRVQSTPWQTGLAEGPRPSVRFGPIASGDKVDASNTVIPAIAEFFDRALGIEMEASGAVVACLQTFPRAEFFMVRGVSDLADPAKDTAPVKGMRARACAVAARFARALVESGLTASVTRVPYAALDSLLSEEAGTSRPTVTARFELE